ncbi:MAG TPA: hypothetical protein VK968_14295, partial [Roseimicrobium sp.]|nr:hypothetical protein [Roseimicrobium sp.]
YSTGTVLPGLADFLSARRVSSATNPLDWTNRPTALPPVTGGQRVVFAGKEETLKAMKSPEFSPATTVYLPEEMRTSVSFTNVSPVQVTGLSWTAHRISFNVSAEAAAVVVVAQSWHPSWKVRVDRSPVPLMRANHAFQAFAVGPGEHSVELIFTSRAFQAGSGISLMALGLCGGVWLMGSRRR